MVKTYQLSQVTPYGSSIKIAPVTNEKETNVRTCLQVNGTAENKIEPQAILPNLDGFTCDGNIYSYHYSVNYSIFHEINQVKRKNMG